MEDFRNYLQNELAQRCQKNPRYSLRAFARSLDYEPSTLCKLLNGKRPMGKRTVQKLAQRLGLNPQETQRFVNGNVGLVSANFSDPLSVSMQYQQLRLDAFELVSDWVHFAILELMRVDSPKHNVKWLAQALNINAAQVRAALERLERIGIFEKQKDGSYLERGNQLTSAITDEVSSVAQRKLQRQLLEKAIETLQEVPMTKRDHSAMTMAINTAKLTEAKVLIKNFRRNMAQFLSRSGKCDEVYNLNIALFPLTNIHKSKRSSHAHR